MHTLLHISSNYVARNVTLEKDMGIVWCPGEMKISKYLFTLIR